MVHMAGRGWKNGFRGLPAAGPGDFEAIVGCTLPLAVISWLDESLL